MSSHRVIAAVTAALKQVLQTVAASVVGGVDIRLGPPSAKIADDETPRINLCLFRISPNAAQRNTNLPVRGSDGSRRRRAEAAVDLHYILSFYGDASAFVPEKLLGATTVALEEVPALFASAIASAVTAIEPPVADPSIAAALAKVRITPQTLTLEEFSKIWSIFFQVPYALSAVYQCSHVVIESQEAYGEAIPIVMREFLAGPVPGFSLLRAAADEAGTGPVLWGGPLHLAGKGLGKVGTGLSIDGKAMALDPEALSSGAIEIVLQSPPIDALAAGIHVVQAIAPKPTPATPEHLRRRTNAVSFALHPKITPGAVAADSMTIAFSPPVHEGQAVTLTLDARNAEGSPKIVLDPEPIDLNNPPAFPLGQIVFPFDALPAGDYLVRAQVDGIPSLPDVVTDPNNPDFGSISGPLATIP